MWHIGIDPGKTGGLVLLNEAGDVEDRVKMPATPRGLIDVLVEWKLRAAAHAMGTNQRRSIRATVERVHSRPGQSSVATFTFGRGFGWIECALAAVAINYNLASPKVWQGALRCRTGGDKNITKTRAKYWWPGTTWTHHVADAALIAEYGRLNHMERFGRS